MEPDLAVFKALAQTGQLQIHDAVDLVAPERQKDHGFVHAVQELGPEMRPQFFHYSFARALFQGAIGINAVQKVHGADVGRHDDNAVAKIHGAPLAVGQAAIVQQLQQRVKDIGVGFFYFVKKNDGIGLAPHGLGKLAALVVAHIAGRRADKAGYGMLFHILAHVQSHHIVFRVKERLGQCLGKLCFSHARGPEENKRAGGSVRVGKTGTGAQDRIGNGVDGFVLSYHALMQLLGQAQQLFAF